MQNGVNLEENYLVNLVLHFRQDRHHHHHHHHQSHEDGHPHVHEHHHQNNDVKNRLFMMSTPSPQIQ
jgi:hypothetical protein